MVLLDVLMGVFTVTLLAVGIFSLLPTVHRSHDIADEESKAVLLANRMLEHLQLLTPSTMEGEILHKLNLIESWGDGKYHFSHTPLDEGSRYSPATSLNKGYGFFTQTDLPGGSVLVNLEIGWTSHSGQNRSIRTGTIVGGYR